MDVGLEDRYVHCFKHIRTREVCYYWVFCTVIAIFLVSVVYSWSWVGGRGTEGTLFLSGFLKLINLFIYFFFYFQNILTAFSTIPLYYTCIFMWEVQRVLQNTVFMSC